MTNFKKLAISTCCSYCSVLVRKKLAITEVSEIVNQNCVVKRIIAMKHVVMDYIYVTENVKTLF
jgi:hypothetical protein